LEIKEQINKKLFKSCSDVDTMASILKSWYRDLPVPVLNVINSEELSGIETINQFQYKLDNLPEPNKSLYFWLMEILVDISSNEKVNKMNSKNLAQSFAPSLYSTSHLELSQQLTVASKIYNLITLFIDSKKGNEN
jgi:hypothetical protein